MNIHFYAFLVCFSLCCSSLFGQQMIETVKAHGNISASVVTGDTLIIGGNFDYVGKFSGQAVPYNVNNTLEAGFPIFNGGVYGIVYDGDAGWYVHGDFTKVNGENYSYLVHILSDYTIDPDFVPNPDQIVTTLGVYQGKIYVGGYFTNIGGKIRNYVACLDNKGAATGWDAQFAFDANYSTTINTIAFHSTGVFIGGSFTNINGVARNGIAKLAISTGVADPNWNLNISPVSYCAFNKIIIIDDLYVAYAATIGDENIVGLNLAFGVPQLSPYFYANNTINTLTYKDGLIYVGGSFGAVGNSNNGLDITRQGVASIDFEGGAISDFDLGLNQLANVKSISFQNGVMFVGGYFTKNESEVNYKNALAYDFNTNALLDWRPNPNNIVNAIEVEGGVPYLGGTFTYVGGEARAGLAAISLKPGETSGKLLPWDPGTPNSAGYFSALVKKDNTLYVGGYFNSIQGQERSNLAAFDLRTMNITNFDIPVDDQVSVLAIKKDTLYLAGSFYTYSAGKVGNENRNYIAAINLKTNSVTNFDPNPDGAVRSISFNKDRIFITGDFTGIGGLQQASIAALNYSGTAVQSWKPTFNSLNPAPALNTGIRTLTAMNNQVFVAGIFTDVNSTAQKYLASLSATNGTLNNWKATEIVLDPDNGSIEKLMPHPLGLWVAGRFSGSNTSDSSLVMLDTLTGKSFKLNMNIHGAVTDFTFTNNTLVVQLYDSPNSVTGPYVYTWSTPTTPTAAAATAVTTTGFTANWTSTDNDNGLRYVLEISKASDNFAPNTFISATGVGSQASGIILTNYSALSLPITGLTSNVAYVYRVRALGVGGTSLSSTQTVTTQTAALPPTITSFAPTNGPRGTTVITVTGTNFNNASEVSVNGTVSTVVTVVSATQLTVKVAATTPVGAGPIVVKTPGGTATSTSNFTVNFATAVDNSFSQEGVTFGPNPVGSVLYVKGNTANASSVTVTILSVNGGVVLQQRFENASRYVSEAVDVSALSPGLYIVEIENNGTVSRSKVIKN